MLFSCETVHISSPAFYKDPLLHESQFRSPADVEINSLASFDAARVKDLFVLLPWLLPLRLGCSARRLGSAARHSSKAAWRLGSPARHGGALRQLATRGAATQRGGHGGAAPWLGSARRRSGAAPRLGGAVCGGAAAWRRNGLLDLARLRAPRLCRASAWPRGSSAALRLCGAWRGGSAAALRRGGSAAWRGEHGAFGVSLFVVLPCLKKKPKPS